MIFRRAFGLPNWAFNNSFDELNHIRRQMDRLFDGISTKNLAGYRSGVFPALNLSEDKDNFYVRAELPGMMSKDLDIEATGKNLSITGERKIPPAEENAKYHRREREGGRFSRVINLPGDINSAKVEASLANGILTVLLPKAEVSKPKQITVN